MRRTRAALAWVLVLGLACASSVTGSGDGKRPAAGRLAPSDDGVSVDASDPGATYLVPNYVDEDGTPAYVHFTADMMPIRIHVERPYESPRDGSPADARAAVIEGFRLWEREMEPELEWFRLEFVDDARAADLVVGWRAAMSSTRKADLRCDAAPDARLRTRCRLDLAIGRHAKPLSASRAGASPLEQLGSMGSGELVDRQTKAQLMNLSAHEFGHVLGLPHCWCDSIMNYSSSDRPYAHIRDIDRRTLLELMEKPNGERVDGTIVRSLREDVAPVGAPLP